MKSIRPRSLVSIIVLSVLALGCGGFLAQTLADGFSKLRKYHSVDEGVSTCFYRVIQSYTAVLWDAQKSDYRKSHFLHETESCFADVLELTRDLSLDPKIVDFDEVANLVHWFHLTILGSEARLGQVQSKFESLESKKENALINYEQLKETEVNSLKYEVIGLLSLFGVIFLGVLFLTYRQLMGEKKILDQRIGLEEKARSYLFHQNSKSLPDCHAFILDTLEQFGLEDTKEFYSQLIMERMGQNKEEDLNEKEDAVQPVVLNQVVETVLDKLNPEFIKNNIFYLDDMNKTYVLLGKYSQCEKMFQEVLEVGASTFQIESSYKTVSLSVNKLGATLNMSIQFIAQNNHITVPNLENLRETLKNRLKGFHDSLVFTQNVALVEVDNKQGPRIQISYTLPEELKLEAPRLKSVRSFKKKDFQPNLDNI